MSYEEVITLMKEEIEGLDVKYDKRVYKLESKTRDLAIKIISSK